LHLQTFVTDGRNEQYETMSHPEKKRGIIICLGKVNIRKWGPNY